VDAELVEDDPLLVEDCGVPLTDVVDAEVVEPGEAPSDAGGPDAPAVADVGDRALLERIAATERAIAALHAAQVEALAEFSRRRTPVPDPLAGDADPVAGRPGRRGDFAVEELMAALRWTAWTASHRLAEAERIAACLPATWSALAAGRIDYARARRIVTAVEVLGEDDAAAVDAAVADVAGQLTTGQLAERLAVEVAAVDAAAAARRAARARRGRRVGVRPLADGMAELVATGPAEDVLAVIRGLTAAAGSRPAPGDDRGIDARRFDALRDAGRALLQAHPAPAGTWRPHVLVTIAATTLLGADDQPAHLHGYGPIPADAARRIAADGVLQRLLTDPFTGTALGLDGHTYPGTGPGGGTPPGDDGPGGNGGSPGPREPATPPTTGTARSSPCPVRAAGGGLYRPSRVLDRLVRLRDRTCTAPGCRRPAEQCDLDHVIRHPDGPTCACNLHPLCRRHHRMKHAGAITVRRLPTGHTVWTLPTGQTCTRPPAPALQRPTVRPPRRDPDQPDRTILVDTHLDSAADEITALTQRLDGPPADPRYAGPPPY
ncbi:MAG: DUF222 domain-containing protein, partial [Actinomycetota bacterium]